MLPKDKFKRIDTALTELTNESNGMYAIMPNLNVIAERANVTETEVRLYIVETCLPKEYWEEERINE